jgi:hypothetical protein
MSSPRTKKLKNVPLASKVMMQFWDFNGSILEHYHYHGQTVNSAWYYAIFAIHSKCRGVPIYKVALHHDDT